MSTPDTRFRIYLQAFFRDLLTGMSGPLSVPFVIAALWVSSRTQKTLYASLAVLCAMFASYRVWQKDRRDISAQLVEKESQLAELKNRVISLTASLAASHQRPKLKVKVSAEGSPQSQVLKLVADRVVTVSRVDYMLSTDAAIAGEDVYIQGESLEIPINDSLLLKVWNTPRADRNNYDHSGPAKIGITVSSDEQSHQFILPVQMSNTMQGNTMFRTIIGSKTFQERV